MQIKQQTGVKFEEFDFSYYNRTPFTGLENDLANCYTNALLQVGAPLGQWEGGVVSWLLGTGGGGGAAAPGGTRWSRSCESQGGREVGVQIRCCCWLAGW